MVKYIKTYEQFIGNAANKYADKNNNLRPFQSPQIDNEQDLKKTKSKIEIPKEVSAEKEEQQKGIESNEGRESREKIEYKMKLKKILDEATAKQSFTS